MKESSRFWLLIAGVIASGLAYLRLIRKPIEWAARKIAGRKA